MKQPSPAKWLCRDGEIRQWTEHAKRVCSRYPIRIEPGQSGFAAIKQAIKNPARGGAWCFSCMPLTQMSSPPGSELPASRNSGWTMLLPAPKMSLMSFQMKRSVHVLPSAPIATPPEIAVSWSRFCSLSTLRVCLPACLRFCFWGHEWPCVVWSLSSHNVFFIVGWRSCATR